MTPDLSRGEWGWNEAKTLWIPPRGLNRPRTDLFRGYTPNPVNLGPLASVARHVHACASRRGGKTHCMGRAAAKRSAERTRRILDDGDPAWPRRRFVEWLESVAGRTLRAGDVARAKWPVPCLALSPTHDLTALQKAELGEIFDPWADELGVAWYDGDSALAILALGCLWRFASAERATLQVGTGNCIIWVGEAARLKPGAWEHFVPSLADREGSLLTDTTPWGGRDPEGYWGQCWVRGDRAEAEQLADERRRVEDILDPETECFHWTADQNLAVPHLRVQMGADRRRYGAGSAYYKRTREASWDLPEGSCWPEWDARTHVRDLQDWHAYDLWVGGMDWGFSESESGHPGALLIAGVTRDRPRRLHVFRGYYGSGILVTPSDGSVVERSTTWAGFALDALDEIRRRTGNARAVLTVYCAPERPEAARALGRPGIVARQADHVTPDGIEDVERLLVTDETTRAPRLTLAPPPAVARDVARDIAAARWATDVRGRALPRFDKAHHDPHGGEALAYLVQAIRGQLDLTAPLGAAGTLRR